MYSFQFYSEDLTKLNDGKLKRKELLKMKANINGINIFYCYLLESTRILIQVRKAIFSGPLQSFRSQYIFLPTGVFL